MDLMDCLMDEAPASLNRYQALLPSSTVQNFLQPTAVNVLTDPFLKLRLDYDDQPESQAESEGEVVETSNPSTNENTPSRSTPRGPKQSSASFVVPDIDFSVPGAPRAPKAHVAKARSRSRRSPRTDCFPSRRILTPRSRRPSKWEQGRNDFYTPPRYSRYRDLDEQPSVDSYRPVHYEEAEDYRRDSCSPTRARRIRVSAHERESSPPDIDMADVDYRERNGGGRGRGRGGNRGYQNNRKRRYDDDDDNDNRPQRRRFEEPQFVKLRRAVLHLADSGARLPQIEAADLGKKVAESFDDENVKVGVLDLILQLVVEQPLKIPIISALCQYANDTRSEVAVELLTRAGAKAQAALNNGRWREFKLVLRFLAGCQGMYSDDGVFGLLDNLFNAAADLQAASSSDTIGLEIVKIILLTIPYALATNATGLEAKVADLLEKTDIVAGAPHALEALVEPYIGSSEDRPWAYKGLLSMLQAQMQSEAATGFKLSCILRAYEKVQGPSGPDGEGLEEAAKHAFPEITIPSPVRQGSKTLFPEAYYSLYADQEIETVPKTTTIASSLIRDCMTDTLNILDFNRTTVAKYLIDVDSFFAPGTFVKRATAFDKLKDIPEGESTWKPEDVAIDAVFSQLLSLPEAEHKLVYYHSVITECCKQAPAAIAPSLGRAIRFLFRNLDGMDMELMARFMDWFAHHLSNFEFRWKWTEWTTDLELPYLNPRKCFISGALDKEIRLSFAKRIRSTLPKEYEPYNLVTEAKEKDTPDFKYNDDRTPYATYGRELLALIRKKSPDETIDIVINQIHDEAAEHGITDVQVPSTDAFVTCILYLGAKSLSHALSIIDRCKDRLLATPDSARIQIVQSVVDYWSSQPGTAVSIIDKLLNYTIITPQTVIQWALDPSRLHEGRLLGEPWAYELVSATMRKVTGRMRQIATLRVQAQINALPQAQIDMLQDTLVKERTAMRQLFAYITEHVQPVASGIADAFIEASTNNTITPDEAELLKEWGAKWNRTFARKAAVEEAQVAEEVMETRVREAKEAAKEAAAEREKREQEEAERIMKRDGEREREANGNGNGHGVEDMDTAEVEMT